MPGSIETAAWRLGQMTAADSEIWDFWIAHRDGALRSSLVRHSFSSDYRDLELIRIRLVRRSRSARRGGGATNG